MDKLIPLGNHTELEDFLIATQASLGFPNSMVPSSTGGRNGEGLRDGVGREEGAVPASLPGAGGRGQCRNPIWQSL